MGNADVAGWQHGPEPTISSVFLTETAFSGTSWRVFSTEDSVHCGQLTRRGNWGRRSPAGFFRRQFWGTVTGGLSQEGGAAYSPWIYAAKSAKLLSEICEAEKAGMAVPQSPQPTAEPLLSVRVLTKELMSSLLSAVPASLGAGPPAPAAA
jgi:hypothetical protein